MASVDTRAIEGEINRLRLLGLEELRREWRRLNHGEPPRISRDLLILALGYKVIRTFVLTPARSTATRPLDRQITGMGCFDLLVS